MKLALHAITILGLALLAGPLGAEAQQQARKVPLIGFLSGSSPVSAKVVVEEFRQGLREIGLVEGQSVIVEYRWAEGHQSRLPDLAIDLVRLAPDLIVAATSPSAMAAHRATASIPIVMVNVGDPVGLGLATSLVRPGKNVTGFTSFAVELAAKQLALFKEVIPEVKRIAVLYNPGNPLAAQWLKDTEAAARTLAVQIQVSRITGPDDVAPAFREATGGRVGAILVHADQVVNLLVGHISALALSNRLPTMGGNRVLAEAGGLMVYSNDFITPYRRVATYVDKILKGAKPGDLPIEQPTKFELLINLKTAKALGLTIPQSVLLRADEVIQ
jgi:putative ABC transport system substrate-binding protein